MNQITSKHLVNLKGEIAIDMKNYSRSSNVDSQKAFDDFSHDRLVQMALNSSCLKF